MNFWQSPSMRSRIVHGLRGPSGSTWMSDAPRAAASMIS
jgi:hypothetical protein